MGRDLVAINHAIIETMAAEPTEIRMARLEGAYEQINERLGSEIGAVHAEIASLRGEIADLRRQMSTQFYWLLTLILGSILIPCCETSPASTAIPLLSQ